LPVSPVMFSSASDEWSTPQALFSDLDLEFDFEIDVAASRVNRKCKIFFGPDHVSEANRDGLSVSWDGLRCFMNPPYSRGKQGMFIAKAARERLRGALTVALLPARTDTKAFHEWIWDAEFSRPRERVEIRFIKGRLKFGGAVNSAPFPSMIVIFRPGVS
jgi:phage N-6-adenine-methyltransferase